MEKNKVVDVDFRRQQREHAPIHVNGDAVEKVKNFMFLGVHLTESQMVHPHRECGEEGATAPLHPQEADEICLVTQNPEKLLQMHNREHPVGLYHSLVWQLHRPQPQGSPEGGVVCTTHHRGHPDSEVSTGASKLGLRD